MGWECLRAERVGKSAYTESRRWRLESHHACKSLSRKQETTEQVFRNLETRRLREKMRGQQETAEQASSRQEKDVIMPKRVRRVVTVVGRHRAVGI